jgi:uncharacterized protein YjbJ (UPF0337 family)
MSDKTVRLQGKLEGIRGTLEKAVGHLIGDERIEVAGRARELDGQAHQERAKARERLKGAIEEAAGAIEQKVGHLLENEGLVAAGKLVEVTGKARQASNKKPAAPTATPKQPVDA